MQWGLQGRADLRQIKFCGPRIGSADYNTDSTITQHKLELLTATLHTGLDQRQRLFSYDSAGAHRAGLQTESTPQYISLRMTLKPWRSAPRLSPLP